MERKAQTSHCLSLLRRGVPASHCIYFILLCHSRLSRLAVWRLTAILICTQRDAPSSDHTRHEEAITPPCLVMVCTLPWQGHWWRCSSCNKRQTYWALSSETIPMRCLTPVRFTISLRHAVRYTWALSNWGTRYQDTQMANLLWTQTAVNCLVKDIRYRTAPVCISGDLFNRVKNQKRYGTTNHMVLAMSVRVMWSRSTFHSR